MHKNGTMLKRQREHFACAQLLRKWHKLRIRVLKCVSLQRERTLIIMENSQGYIYRRLQETVTVLEGNALPSAFALFIVQVCARLTSLDP